MTVPFLPLLASVKLLIDKPYLSKLVQMQIIGGELLLPRPPERSSLSASSSGEIIVTDVIDDINPGDEAIFYHPVFGPVFAHEYGPYYFSTQRFVNNLRAADESPNVIAHFMHICSGGGEAWFLDKAAEAVRECRKPVYAFIEMTCCSAAYYLAVNASVIKAYTKNDTIGSVGVMCSFWDEIGFWEKMGFRHIEVYADGSDMKNKKFNDLVAGNAEQFIKDVLNPLREQFVGEIRSAREQLAKLPGDDPVMRGETYDAATAIGKGLIDGIADIGQALRECYELGITNQNNNNIIKEI